MGVSAAGTEGDPAGAPEAVQLRRGALTLAGSLGQSIATIGPTLTPALNIAVVASLAGVGSWLAYLVATVGLLFVAANIGTLARRHPLSGSYFVYVGRTLGPFAGLMAGWSMVGAYLFTAVAVTVSFTIFFGNVLTALGLAHVAPPGWLVMTGFMAVVWTAGYRDIRLSSRVGLFLEAISVGLIVLITAIIVVRHGTAIDAAQLTPANIKLGGVTSALAFAVFSFVGFESAATLAQETRDAGRNVPRAVTLSAGLAGIFFVAVSYCMMLGMNDDAAAIGSSEAPFSDLTMRAGLGWAAAIIYFSALISSFACGLASINAVSRLLFSMGRYKFLAQSAGAIHRRHQTPHLAVTFSCGLVLVVAQTLLPLGALDAFGYAGTLATFGFLIVYLLVCIVSPIDLHRAGVMKGRHAAVGVIGTLLMAFVIVGSMYPVAPYPFNLLPYLFVSYLALGGAWFGWLRMRNPHALASMEHDLEMLPPADPA